MNLDYHVEIDKHFYSVPFRLLREQVEARITAKTVEIFHHGKLVAPSSGIPTATPPEPWPASPRLAFQRLRRRNLGQPSLVWHSNGYAAGTLASLAHLRSLRPHRPTTLAEHMPSSHRRYRDWTHERILREAASIGDDTAALAEIILRSRPHPPSRAQSPEQGFRSCIGILGLAKRYDAERLDAACARALALGDAAKGSACEAGGMAEEGRARTARSRRS